MQVKMTETYDLSTKTNKMGMIAIHTPSMDTVSRMWSGLCQNFRKIRMVGADVVLACASMLPADPLQVGTEAGDIAPQDMFNPILYTAVSNDSFGTLQTRLYSLGYFNGTQSASVDYDADPLPDTVDNWGVYYSLLASPGFRKAMPTRGLEMNHLVPIVHTVTTNVMSDYRTNPSASTGSEYLVHTWEKSDGALAAKNIASAVIKGPSMRMPAIPTMYWNTQNNNTEQFGSTIQMSPADIPATYVGCIIMPPAKLHKLYYRMSVTWHFEFIDLCPNTERSTLANLEYEGLNRFYYTDYADQSSKMEKVTNMVDTIGFEAEKIMES